MLRSTLIVPNAFAAREEKLRAARKGTLGLQVLTLEQAVGRLAGGFQRLPQRSELRAAIEAAVGQVTEGDLALLKRWPGTVRALSRTLSSMWSADIDLDALPYEYQRLSEVEKLEQAVQQKLPAGRLPPSRLVREARRRLRHAPAILGDIEVRGFSDLDPCWRPLLLEIASKQSVVWNAGPRAVPAWLKDTPIKVVKADAATPCVQRCSAPNDREELLAALRWARQLIVEGRAAPHEIAIAATNSSAYDSLLLAIRQESKLPLAFAGGCPALATRAGQAAAALADILSRGVTQSRLRRLSAFVESNSMLGRLPLGWQRVLPTNAVLSRREDWQRYLDALDQSSWPDGKDAGELLRETVDLLWQGSKEAEKIGEAFLEGSALAIWQQALLVGGSATIDQSLAELRIADEVEPCASIVWVEAATLAAAPRSFVWLLGLSAGAWPRPEAEDPILPSHVLPSKALTPVSIRDRDTQTFEAILATTKQTLVVSRSRHDAKGRPQQPSPLLLQDWSETRLTAQPSTTHVLSEDERLLGQPLEFAENRQAQLGLRAWRNWQIAEATSNDGLVRSHHPAIEMALNRRQSASSLTLLMRNPLAFVWRYALGVREPQIAEDTLVLSPPEFGNVIHHILETAVLEIEAAAGLARADKETILLAISRARDDAARRFVQTQAVPPASLWARTLDEACRLAIEGLTSAHNGLAQYERTYVEVPFGGLPPTNSQEAPWDIASEFMIPGTEVRIAGYIDRLDLSGDRLHARVVDYKTGRPKSADIRLDGGRELQRVIYAHAAQSGLSRNSKVSAELIYLRRPVPVVLEDLHTVLSQLAKYINAARCSLQKGAALPGIDAGEERDNLRFALPAHFRGSYRNRKDAAFRQQFGRVTDIWIAP